MAKATANDTHSTPIDAVVDTTATEVDDAQERHKKGQKIVSELEEAAKTLDEAHQEGIRMLRKLCDAKTNKDRRAILDAASGLERRLTAATAATFYLVKVGKADLLKDTGQHEMLKAIEELVRDIDKSELQSVVKMLFRDETRYLDELVGSYADGGCFYAGTPLGLDFGFEVGIKTGGEKELKRSGLVVGLRLDHLTGSQPNVGFSFGKNRK